MTDYRTEAMQGALSRVEGLGLLAALEVLIEDMEGAAGDLESARAPGAVLSGARGVAIGLRLAATLAHDRAFKGEAL